MPINPTTLLTDLKRWVTLFEDDLRQQCKDVSALDTRLKAQFKQAKDAGRTAFSYAVWRDGELTQSAVGWVLSCVFVRFLEDNDLLERSFLSGVGENRGVADETRAAYFRENRAASDNDYLAHVMSEVGKLPGMADLMDARHNALWNAAISPDAAKAFIEFWRRIDPSTGKMAHEFTDPDWDTRFLGDLYQDLSESARKKFALLQTPDFVEEFILDRTLDPAINTFGLKVVRMIDPTCGSGHFLLGGFRRLLALWEKERPDLSDKERAVKALDGVFGVDINPFAVAIARFRLLLAAWRYCGVRKLRSAPDFKVNLAVGDSLLHGARFDAEGKPYTIGRESLFGGDELVFKDETAHHFEVEDAKELHRILGQQYHAVVGNPPYITVKDKALNELYRARYLSCHRKYALSVPFMERFFDLTIRRDVNTQQTAGFVGQITGNNFMKREFGKKLIEEYLPRWDVTHVLDTAGAYIPGHGTPTVILFGKNQKPVSNYIRTVLGIRGEPATPDDPSFGVVWQAILEQMDHPGSTSEWVSSADSPRENFHRHPWSIGGGGAAELKEKIDAATGRTVFDLIEIQRRKPVIGFGCVFGEDEIFQCPRGALPLSKLPAEFSRPVVEGDLVRDWSLSWETEVLFPYTPQIELRYDSVILDYFWTMRTLLGARKDFAKRTYRECGRPFWEYHQIPVERNQAKLLITFSEISTHNHFVLDRGGKIFNRTAPIIKLKSKASETTHIQLLGLLNSSIACFWLKQVCHNKGDSTDNKGARTTGDVAFNTYGFNATQVANIPVPRYQPTQLPAALDKISTALRVNSPSNTLAIWDGSESKDLGLCLGSSQAQATLHRCQLIALQEELDWQIYEGFGLIEGATKSEQATVSLPESTVLDIIPSGGIALGQRAFEIVLARRMAAGEVQTSWFTRHDSKPVTEIPSHWSAPYRELVERRIQCITNQPSIRLIEQPEYKRRWNTLAWNDQQERALRHWLLDRLSLYFHSAEGMFSVDDEAYTAAKLAHILPLRARFVGGMEPRLVSVRQLAQTAQTDSQWMEAATVFAGRADFDVPKLVETLVLAESVPALPVQRYKPAGLRKREEWEKTWELQRAEDVVEEEIRGQNPGVSEEELKKKIRKAQLEAVGDIPVPPKYGSGDFLKSTYWKLRGKLDVPKERWVLYPGMEGGHDTSPVIAWAGWDHAQQAAALTAFYQQAKDTWGWAPERLAPLLAALKELLPWLHQWHNAIDPEYGDRISTTYQQFYETELHALRMTDEDIERIRMGHT